MPIRLSPTAINELQNRPRQDIDRQRYGNTLSDDMFSIKNPSLPNRHTPESIDYFNQSTAPSVNTAMAPAAGWGPLPVLNNSNLASRRKSVGEGTPLTVNKDWGLVEDIMEFPENYTDEQFAWAEGQRDKRETEQRINDLSAEGLRNEQFGNAPTTQSSYRNSEYDPYLGTFVNYSAMSPETMDILARMGVNRPQTEDEKSLNYRENGNDSYNSLLNLYRLAIENGWR